LKRSISIIALVVTSLLFATGWARQQPLDQAPRTGSEWSVAESTAVDELEPVAVPEPSEQALRFYRSGNWLWVLNHVWALLLTAGLAFSGLSARLRTLAARLSGLESVKPDTKEAGRESVGTKNRLDGRIAKLVAAAKRPVVWFLTIGFYVVLYLAIVSVLDLPLAYYEGFVRLHAYGLSNQTLAKWFHDWIIGVGLAMAVGFAFAWVPYFLLARSPRRWWLYTSILSIPFMYGVMLVDPIWIDPLFNKFGPMKNKTLEQSILALAERAGIEGSRVFEVDKSVDTKAVNAYVKGVFATKRIVLWDTLIAKLEKDELLFVMGHEMGHYVLGHVVRSIWLFAVVTLIGLFLVDWMGRWLVARYSDRLGFNQLADVASVPLLTMFLEVTFLVLSPVALAYSRSQEHAADRFALDLTRSNHSGATAFVKLQLENLANPRPGTLFKLVRGTHPSIGERVDFCNTYHPWRSSRSAEGATGNAQTR
jgi:Zn-dependent protease with chaperone function